MSTTVGPDTAWSTAIDGNYVPASQSGCHIAHHNAPWIIESSDFDLEDYGLDPGQEDSVPEMIVDPETKSLRCPTLFTFLPDRSRQTNSCSQAQRLTFALLRGLVVRICPRGTTLIFFVRDIISPVVRVRVESFISNAGVL